MATAVISTVTLYVMSVLVQKTCSAPVLLKLSSKGISSSSVPSDQHRQEVWYDSPGSWRKWENPNVSISAIHDLMFPCNILYNSDSVIVIFSSFILEYCCPIVMKQYLSLHGICLASVKAKMNYFDWKVTFYHPVQRQCFESQTNIKFQKMSFCNLGVS